MKMKWLIALLLLNAAYVAALPSATIFYVANVLLHVILGLAGVVVLCWQWRRSPKIAVLLIAALLGGFLVVKGAVTDNRWAVWAHVALGVAGLAILLSRLSDQDDVVVGTPVANRPRLELEGWACLSSAEHPCWTIG